jgi:type I site-specific restriction-modification system R (restriction) subunit
MAKKYRSRSTYFDFENPENNDFLAIKEFEVEEEDRRRRFDLCLFVNGIPSSCDRNKESILGRGEGKHLV